jgi:hypothetical protein
MSYIGVLGVNTFDDEIEDAINILVNRIISDFNYTSNYVWTTSNIIATRINDTSNVFVITVKDTSNYVDTLDLCLKVLEGTEGSPDEVSLGIPAIPSTGLIELAGFIVVIIAIR